MLTWGQGTSPAECVLRWQEEEKESTMRVNKSWTLLFHLLSYFKCNSSLNGHLYCGVQQPDSAVGNGSMRRAVHGPNWQEINTWPETRSWQTALSWGRGEGTVGWLTPQVVMTGSLNTLQHSWQQSLTEGCSANTCGSWVRKESKGERERECQSWQRCMSVSLLRHYARSTCE